MPNKLVKHITATTFVIHKGEQKLLMVYTECKYFFNLSLNNRVEVIYFRYSGKEHHNWLPLYVTEGKDGGSKRNRVHELVIRVGSGQIKVTREWPRLRYWPIWLGLLVFHSFCFYFDVCASIKNCRHRFTIISLPQFTTNNFRVNFLSARVYFRHLHSA